MNPVVLAGLVSICTAVVIEFTRFLLARRQKRDDKVNENSLVLEVRKIDDAASLRKEYAEERDKVLKRVEELQADLDEWKKRYFDILPAKNENEELRKEVARLQAHMTRLEQENKGLKEDVRELQKSKKNI
jgi:peptidoglycan hydrolase CwlO-like protein